MTAMFHNKEKKDAVIPVHDERIEGTRCSLQLYSCLALALYGGKCSVSRPDRFTTGEKDPPVPAVQEAE